MKFRARLVHVFKNWKLLFKNFCGNTCGWKNVLKYVKCCLKTENCCLKTLTKHPLINLLLCCWKPIPNHSLSSRTVVTKTMEKKEKKKKSVILEFYIYIYICLNNSSGAVLLYLADMIRPINWQQTRTPPLHSHAVVYSNSLQLVLQFHHGNRCSQASIFQTP